MARSSKGKRTKRSGIGACGQERRVLALRTRTEEGVAASNSGPLAEAGFVGGCW